VVFILCLIYVPLTSRARAREANFQSATPDSEKIYYRLTVLDPAQKLPRIAPVGPGAQPGRGELVEKLPALGSTVQQHNLTVVSRPFRPDNKRQTIFQPAAPPDLRITTELKLPNIVEARPVVVPKPESNFHPKDSRPAVPNRQNVTAAAPAFTATSTLKPLTDLSDPTKAHPEMPVSPPSAPAPAPTQANAPTDANTAVGLETQAQAQGSGLVVISTDPGEASDMVALPTGNRFADFSISPAGGLAVYGALHCGKIYTIFLQMPGKAWTLQFCQAGAGNANTSAERNSPIVHMEQGITPPDAEDRFDFKRLPLTEDKVHKLIVLKGVLREDGTVEGVRVHQGLLPVMDEAARLAFSKWKFRPATRGGKAIQVDILVGIPSDPPPAGSIARQ